MEKKNLFLFDFDETLTVRSSELFIEELSSDKEKVDLKTIDFRYVNVHRCWSQRMNELFESLSKENVSTDEIVEAMRKIDLSRGSAQLFREIHQNNGEIVVVSDFCDFLIEKTLRFKEIFQFLTKIESNRVRQVQPWISIENYENPSQTVCQHCPPNLCKGLIVERYRKTNRYEKICFVGDGTNDVCPALKLQQNDFVFAKVDLSTGKNFPLAEKLIKQEKNHLRASLFFWENIEDVHRTLKEQRVL